MLHEPQVERPEHHDDPDVHRQPLPEVVPEEQDVHDDHDGYHREHVKDDGCRSSHAFLLLRTALLVNPAGQVSMFGLSAGRGTSRAGGWEMTIAE
jgi:hypothetical protein